ncbi:MAG: outer membrane lipoprotein carrier protein LolA [Hellea sp.]|nr:outer membrane lipoprotein carrier protein LolA [Hellea sp.]
MKKLKQIVGVTALMSALAISAGALGQTSPAYSGGTPVYAAFTDPQNVENDLNRIDAALNSITDFEGRFTQYSPDGRVDTGIIYLSRPGRMRFEYDDPNPLLVVSDGVTLVQHDKALEMSDRVPLSSTPLNFFLKENVQLARDTEVVGLTKSAQEIRVTARDGSGEMDGVISMIFDPVTLAFQAWIIGDSFGGETRIVLSDLSYNGNINPRLFIHDDDNRRDRRRR